MANEARRRQVPEPEPSALGHRAFRAKLAAVTTADAAKARESTRFRRFFPTPPRTVTRVASTWHAGKIRTRPIRRPRIARLHPRRERGLIAGFGPTRSCGISIFRRRETWKPPWA